LKIRRNGIDVSFSFHLVFLWYLCGKGVVMGLVLVVDGGGSGCRAAVADESGQILGQGRAGPANIMTDPDAARANILAAAATALADSGQAATLADLAAVLGLAGANVAGNAARLAALLPFARVRVETDATIALVGAHQDQDGIAATIGTGSVFGRQRGGVRRQIGGWGLVLGDEGSGAWIGRAALTEVLHAADGLVSGSPLLAGLRDRLGGADAVVTFARTASPGDFSDLAREVVAAPDDAAAARILSAADDWIARGIGHLQVSPTLPVTFLGGLGPVFAQRLSPRYPGLIRAAMGSALDGALWLARTEGW